jgi:hypothetical protein
MLLNYGLQRLAPNIINPVNTGPSVNQVLGLRKSPYAGLQQVGKQDLYFKNNQLYEPYTITRSAPSYPIYGIGSISGGPLYQNSSYPIYGIGHNYGYNRTNEAEGTIKVGDQAFRPYTGDTTPRGFIKSGDGYEKDMIYYYSKTSQPTYRPTPNITSFLPSPTSMPIQSGNYGAGQYLNSGSGLLGGGFNFGTPSGKTAG